MLIYISTERQYQIHFKRGCFAFHDFCVTSVQANCSDQLFHPAHTNRWHTLNASAYDVWTQMADINETKFWTAFSWIKIIVFRISTVPINKQSTWLHVIACRLRKPMMTMQAIWCHWHSDASTSFIGIVCFLSVCEDYVFRYLKQLYIYHTLGYNTDLLCQRCWWWRWRWRLQWY